MEIKKLSDERKQSIENLKDGEALYFNCKYEDDKDFVFSHYFIAKCPYLDLAKKYIKYEPLVVISCIKVGISIDDALKLIEPKESATTSKYQLVRLARDDLHIQIMSFEDLNDPVVIEESNRILGMFIPVIYSTAQEKISVEDMYSMIDSYVKEKEENALC